MVVVVNIGDMMKAPIAGIIINRSLKKSDELSAEQEHLTGLLIPLLKCL
jgi:hypothetical protein